MRPKVSRHSAPLEHPSRHASHPTFLPTSSPRVESRAKPVCHLIDDNYPPRGERRLSPRNWGEPRGSHFTGTGVFSRMAIGHLKTYTALLRDLSAARALAAARKFTPYRRPGYAGALRPGPATPLWNELAAAVRRAFRRRGEKARLARSLGISRQRLHVLIVKPTACPDAERTLQLILWLEARRNGGDLV